VGDKINITVAAGSLKYTLHDASATDGSQVAYAIAFNDCDASAGDITTCLVTNRLQEVAGDKLTWKSGISAPNKAAGIVSLAAKNIIVR